MSSSLSRAMATLAFAIAVLLPTAAHALSVGYASIDPIIPNFEILNTLTMISSPRMLARYRCTISFQARGTCTGRSG